MASSSVSQESLDRDEYSASARRNRARPLRSRATHKTDTMDPAADREEAPEVGACGGADHDSPTRTTGGRAKDKRGRSNHMKGKSAKDKRKLREKRRSTGVAHMPSTESTGDSLDEDEQTTETKKNTSYNEKIEVFDPQSPDEDRKSFASSTRNKSPSDLEADFEDNQDYDSTVSQSETNLTIIGQSSPQTPVSSKFRVHTATASIRMTSLSNHSPAVTSRPVSYPSSQHPGQDLSDITAASGRGTLGARLPPARGNHRETRSSSQDENGESYLLARNRELQKLLDIEREENARYRDLIEDRDQVIQHLQQEIALLNQELDQADLENEKLVGQKVTLLKAMSRLNTKDGQS